MEAKKNPRYLLAVSESVMEFGNALERFLGFNVINDWLARGLAPAVLPRDDADPVEIARAASEVDLASGRASAAASLTNCMVHVQGIGSIDPIAVWYSITKPKPVLEPDDILSACNQMMGRLEQMIRKSEAEEPPPIGAEAMHPLIWGAARRLWGNGHFRQAVAAAAESLISHVKVLTGRNDVPDTSLWQETFSEKEPMEHKPRLRWPGEPKDRDVRAMNDGLRQFAAGVQLTIRNGAVHGAGEVAEQHALERLATLSLLARWVEDCELVEYRGEPREGD